MIYFARDLHKIPLARVLHSTSAPTLTGDSDATDAYGVALVRSAVRQRDALKGTTP